jgi:hypothetical protein
MKELLLCLMIIAFSPVIMAQNDTTFISKKEIPVINVNIYPVPVRDNSFTITSDKEISYIKITNVIGQDIFRNRYSTPQTISKVILDNPQRGMYIVSITFADNTRIVRKIMIDGYN